MTTRQIELVESSWDFIVINTEEAGLIFYERLFQINPELRALFKTDIKDQSRKLLSLITFAVHKLDNLNEIISDVKALGIRHKKYNVKPEHYTSVASALLWTIEKILGNRWNDEIRDAWVEVYTVLSKTMIDAANEVPVSTPN